MEDGENTLAMSFLDVISCALGGAILLGLVLSVIRVTPPVTVSSRPNIVMSWRVPRLPDGTRPLLNVSIKPPGASRPFDLPITDFNPLTGRLIPSATSPEAQRIRAVCGNGAAGGGLIASGFSYFGDVRLGTNTDKVNETGVYHVTVIAPIPGKWEFGIRISSAASGSHPDSYDFSDFDRVLQIESTLSVPQYRREQVKTVSTKMTEHADCFAVEID